MTHEPLRGDTQPPQPWSEAEFEPGYLKKLAADIMPTPEERAGRQFGVHIIDGSDPTAALGRHVELTVFQERFPSNDINLMRREYGPYDRFSTMLVVMDYEKQQPAGVLRLITPNPLGHKSLADLTSPDGPNTWGQKGHSPEERVAEMGNDLDHTVDLATFGVMPEYKSGHSEMGVSAALYSTSVRWSLASGNVNWMSIIDSHAYDMIQAWGSPFIPFKDCGFEPYLDSKASIPVHLNVPERLKNVRSHDESIYQLYTTGTGLDAMFLLPNFE